jgi:DNA-binding ferritin-like protein
VIGQLIVRCFHARTAAHVLHLTTRSYATHKALNEFYDDIVPLVDALAESYTGLNGLITDLHAPYIKPSDPVQLIADLADWIDDNRYKCCDKSETMIQNIIDEILALCAATLYKLRILK